MEKARKPRAKRSRLYSLKDPASLELFGGVPTTAGINVNEQTSLYCSTVLAAVKVLCEEVAKLPLHIYRYTATGKERYPEHPLYFLLHDEPNPHMDSFQFFETLMLHLLLYGNCYAEIERANDGRIVNLWPILPDRVTVTRGSNGDDYSNIYTIRNASGSTIELAQEFIFHVSDFSFDTIKGISRMRLIREAIGWIMAMEQFGSAFFGNGSTFGAFLVHPTKLDDNARKNIRDSMERFNRGSDKAFRFAVFEEGLKPESLGIAPEQAQYVQSRQFGMTLIAQAFRIPPHKIGDLSRSTNNNIEHQSLEFVRDCLSSWTVRWEKAINRQLLLPSEKGKLFARFNVDGILRGDITTRYNAYSSAINTGWRTRNEVRELEDLNTCDGLDEFLSPLNMGKVTAAPQEEPLAVEQAQRAKVIRSKMSESYQGLFESALARIVGRELIQLRKVIRKGQDDPASVSIGVHTVYQELHPFIGDALGPIIENATRLVGQTFGLPVPDGEPVVMFARRYANELATDYTDRSKADALQALQSKGPEGLSALTVQWEPIKAQLWANDWVRDTVDESLIWLGHSAFGGSSPVALVSANGTTGTSAPASDAA